MIIPPRDVGATCRVARAQRIHSARAFTLIEVMVVLLIISIMAGVAVLNITNYVRSRHVETIANDLAVTIPLAEQQAILQPAILGLQITSHNYGYYRFVIDPQSNSGTWQPLSRDRILTQKTIPNDVSIAVTTNAPDQENKNIPQIIFQPSGDVSVFKIYLGTKAQGFSYRVEGKPDGTIKLLRSKSES